MQVLFIFIFQFSLILRFNPEFKDGNFGELYLYLAESRSNLAGQINYVCEENPRKGIHQKLVATGSKVPNYLTYLQNNVKFNVNM